jgi:hypothetical protein
MSAISPMGFNDKPKFIIIVAEKREIYQPKSNFELSDKIKNFMFLRTLVMISKVSYTST